MSERAMHIMSFVSFLLIVWLVASWADIVAHNMTTCQYAWWNLIAMFFRG